MIDVESAPLLLPQEGRIWVTQKPWSTWPKIPWSSISSADTSLGNITSNNIVPVTNNAYGIGTTSKRYANIYSTAVETTTITADSWTIDTFESENATIENLTAQTAAIGTAQFWVVTINSSNTVQTAATASDSYINITLNWTTYKLLLAS